MEVPGNPSYWVNNPSAWYNFDQGASDLIEALVDERKKMFDALEAYFAAGSQFDKEDEFLCCTGRDCSCLGATVHQFAEFQQTSALKVIKEIMSPPEGEK